MSSHDSPLLSSSFDYDVALSFAGESREYAARVAQRLSDVGVRVFYDVFSEADLWGMNLLDRLAHIYRSKARFCVVFLSKDYASSKWTNLERQNAQARALIDPDYLLPIRLDDTPVPGFVDTLRYVDARTVSESHVVDLILQKVRGQSSAQGQQLHNTREQATASDKERTYVPKIAKSVTQRDRDVYAEETFRTISKYFEDGLQTARSQYSEFEYSIQHISPRKFVCKAYVRGELRSQCKVWIGGFLSDDSINYAEGRISVDRDDTINDFLTITHRDGLLGLGVSGMNLGAKVVSGAFLSQHEAAEYLWTRFVRPLES